MKVPVRSLRTCAAVVVAAITLLAAAGPAVAVGSPPVEPKPNGPRTATIGGTAGTTPSARVPVAGTTGGTTGTNAPAGPFSNAPTENLFRIASHLSLRQKSVTSVVTVPAKLGITSPVEISILFGTQRITQNYSEACGDPEVGLGV
jgi:hypothetical protein